VDSVSVDWVPGTEELEDVLAVKWVLGGQVVCQCVLPVWNQIDLDVLSEVHVLHTLRRLKGCAVFLQEVE